MAGETGILAQSNPSAATLTSALTVGGGGETISEIYIANTGSAGAAVRLAISPAGAAVATEHYLLYDEDIGVGRTLTISFRPKGLRLGAGTIVRVYASTANVSFNILA